MTNRAAVAVIAKAPAPGRSKTRLCPPCTPSEAALLAEAALVDTLAAMSKSRAARRVLALEGAAGDRMPDGFEVVEQQGCGLGQRLDSAFSKIGGPTLLIGMDTPQVTAELLDHCLGELEDDAVDAVLGHSFDGGFWAIGLRKPIPGLFDEVPMSTPVTGAVQAQRLTSLGLRWSSLPSLRDVDLFEDAVAVAQQGAGAHFSSTLASLRARIETRCA